MRLVNIRPGRQMRFYLAALPFVLLAIAYFAGSGARLAENPNDKLLPALSSMTQAVNQMAFHVDARTGSYLMLADTLASLERLVSALAISTTLALLFGITIGLLPGVNALLGPFVSVTSMVPPLALLPILFIVLGLGETSKIALRVALPQMLPRLLDSLRLQLGPAWLFLIAAEAIASDSGLGYRIFLVRRYLAMDIILPYVAWITLLAFLMDAALRLGQRKLFPWFASMRAE